jgi:predicted membrane-bound dolichyl-phosphate-mannose-protein mannosyltransferase
MIDSMKLPKFFTSFASIKATKKPLINYFWLLAALLSSMTLVGLVAYINATHLFTTIDIDQYAQKYSQSQYILGEASPAKISDSELYVYASHAYWQGQDPTTINFEHPPLAKYYYGLFLWVVGNPYWGSVVLFAATLGLVAWLAHLVGLRPVTQILVLVLTGLLSLLQVHTRYALLDLPQLVGTLLFFVGFFMLCSVYFGPHKRNFEDLGGYHVVASLFAGIGLGIVISSKYWFPWVIGFAGLVGLVIGVIAWFSYKKDGQLLPKHIVRALPFVGILFIAVVIYLTSYAVYFTHGHSLFDLVQFERYRFSWFMGKTDSPLFLIFQTLFTGRYETYWDPGNYEVTQHWSLLWPTSFLVSIVVFVHILFDWWRKRQFEQWQLVLVLAYSFGLLLVFSLGSAASDRFFVQLLPFWLIGVGALVEKVVKWMGK